MHLKQLFLLYCWTFNQNSIIIIIDNDNNEVNLMKSKADLIMHPVRMKIIQHLSKGPATVAELLDVLEEIPQATLYRHLNTLKKGNILTVTNEKQIRGTTEKTYALQVNGSRITPEEGSKLTKDEHMNMFTTFFANLMRQTEEFFDGDVDLTKDIYGFSQVDLHLNEQEWETFKEELYQVIKPYTQNSRRSDTKKITMAQFFVSEPNHKKGN
ncbi:helix-turn-helix domain-containing protein [Jeotgalibacillus sp. HH7-29]|uniref:Helix-turn-helix domain-containing protein n=2 Tax=Jeotgalibacillus haloalkalitolerans TaxID=3104292 RepID=A0ABU5KHP8_9BACL|nr:helix-turn-helix domain-containing protein [Jeotgalibacillus sp. HH7-29]